VLYAVRNLAFYTGFYTGFDHVLRKRHKTDCQNCNEILQQLQGTVYVNM